MRTQPSPATETAVAGRAAPMSREQRRAAIVAATLPLLRADGYAVTTRQIAEAGGIGEGTIFRVFTDKAELITACMSAAFDPGPALARLHGIDRGLPLPARLLAAVEILQERLRAVIELLIAPHFAGPPEDRAGAEHSTAESPTAEGSTAEGPTVDGPTAGSPAGRPRPRGLDPRAEQGQHEILQLIEELLEPDRHLLRTTPAETARVARLLTFAATHPRITEDQPMTAEDIVAVLLYGVLKREDGVSC
ncbi:MAG: TetR family transcriptional regulator [Jatrophihabitans sp.]